MTGAIQSFITIVLFILILGALVVIHELGHFVIARLANVRVLEFGVGFPPRARVLRSRGETLYTLNWLPIGGFVKLEGEDGNDAGDPRSFAAQGLARKLLILVAGVVMNVVLAFAIFTSIAWLATPYVGVRFHEVQSGSPAADAGLVPGDAIVAVNDTRYEFFGNESILDGLRGRAGQQVVLTIDHADGSRAEVPVALRPPEEINETQGALGIGSSREAPFEAYFSGEYTGRDLPAAAAIGGRETVRAL
jgi:regulator of sigma E protease